MKILLQQVKIADPISPNNGNVKDILIENGVIKVIGDNLNDDSAQILTVKNIIVSPGWVDVFSNACDPGDEFKETLETCADAAAAGGYTQIFVLPDTNPVIDSKTQVEYVKQKSNSLKIKVHPLGSITKKKEGKELAEMYDMYQSGAVAFTDGLQPLQYSGLLLKGLQYIKAFNGVIIQLPQDKSINSNGLINEGLISTQLGLPGMPAIAEEIIIERDIELASYTNSAIHFTGISTAKSVELIKVAKEKDLKVTCSVTPYHLFFCDADLQLYDTNLKVNPPLRDKKNMIALRQAVLNGYVDCIASHHLPQDWDNKTCEFEYAKFGMIGLQTSFAAIKTVLPGLTDEQIINLFSLNARKIFNLNDATIREGNMAEITMFNDKEFVLKKENIKSKSHNSAFINKALHGNVIGVISKGNLILNN